MKMSLKRKKSGFTLVEIMTTTAIMSTVIAIAVPNFVRIRAEVNMERVRQDLKKIHSDMNDLLNKNHQFPDDIADTLSSNGDEEMSIAAGLFSVDQKDYINDDYRLFANSGQYELRSCPKEDKWGISGDKCFMVDPLGVHILSSRWETSGNIINGYYGAVGGQNHFTSFLEDTNLVFSQKVDIMTDALEAWALNMHFLQNASDYSLASTFLAYGGIEENKQNHQRLIERVFENLKNQRNVQIFAQEITPSEAQARIDERGEDLKIAESVDAVLALTSLLTDYPTDADITARLDKLNKEGNPTLFANWFELEKWYGKGEDH